MTIESFAIMSSSRFVVSRRKDQETRPSRSNSLKQNENLSLNRKELDQKLGYGWLN